ERLAAVEAKLRERERGKKREGQRQDHDDRDDDEAVADVLPEVLSVDRVAEVRERRGDRQPLRGVSDDVRSGLERRRDHPVDRKGHPDEDDQADEIPARLPQSAPPADPLGNNGSDGRRSDWRDRAHWIRPAFTIWRT